MGKGEFKIEKPTADVLATFIKEKVSGDIYRVKVQSPEHSNGKCILVQRQKRRMMKIKDVQQKVVKGIYVGINEHEYRQWMQEEKEFYDKYTPILVKRVILSELLIEADEEILNIGISSKHEINQLKKTEKMIERTICKVYDDMYDIDKDMLTNFVKNVEDNAKMIAGLGVEMHMFLKPYLQKFVENPQEFTPDKIELVKVQ